MGAGEIILTGPCEISFLNFDLGIWAAYFGDVTR